MREPLGTNGRLSFLTRANKRGPVAGTSGDQRPGPYGDQSASLEGCTGPRSDLSTGVEETYFADWLDYFQPYDWTEAEQIGRNTGHVLTECDGCHNKALVSIYDGSSLRGTKAHPWPVCRLCFTKARVVPIGDLGLVKHRRPGQPRTKRQLREDGVGCAP